MGKRKREGDSASGVDDGISQNSLFIRNLPFEFTSEQLEEIFTEIGPIKNCFVVTDKITKTGKGFGICRFVENDDAVEAVKQLNGTQIQGRAIKIEFAKKREPQTREKPVVPAAEVDKETKSDGSDSDGGDSDDSDDDDGDSDDSDGSSDGEDSDATDGKAKTKPASAKTKGVTTTTKTASDVPIVPVGQKKPKSQRAASSTTANRIVVITNLAKDVTSKHVYHRCRKLGKVELSGVSAVENNKVEVLFDTHVEARDAAEKLNNSTFKAAKIQAILKTKIASGDTTEPKADKGDKGKKFRLILRNLSFNCTEPLLRNVCAKFGPLVEVQIVLDKVTQKSRGFAFVRYKSALDAAQAVGHLNGKAVAGRKIAVDWTVPKNDFDAQKKKAEDEADDDASSSDDDDDDDDDDENDTSKKKKKKNTNNDDDDDDDADEDDDDDNDDDDDDDSDGDDRDSAKGTDDEDDDDDDEDEIEKSRDVGYGCTVFVRNVSYDTTADKIQASFEEFGTVVMCKIVEDFGNGRSRGMAFVKFKTREETNACLARSAQTLLAPIECEGRVLNITLAVDRSEAAKITDDNESKRTVEKEAAKKLDKRNLYLLREGVIMNNSQAYKEMSPGDRSLRRNLEMESQQKSKNPNFAVSRTRISVHNIPREMTESNLKKAVLSSIDCQGKLVQVKIVRSKDRVGQDGKNRSMGFGFLEFMEHGDAVATIRALNNNPTVFDKARRPILQFAWFDVRVIRKILRRREQSTLRVERVRALEGNGTESEQRNRPNTIKPAAAHAKPVTVVAATTTNDVDVNESSGGGSINPTSLKKRTPGSRNSATSERRLKQATIKIKKKSVTRAGKAKHAEGSARFEKNRKSKMSNAFLTNDPESKTQQKKRSRTQRKERQEEAEGRFESLVDRYKSNLMKTDDNRWFA